MCVRALRVVKGVRETKKSQRRGAEGKDRKGSRKWTAMCLLSPPLPPPPFLCCRHTCCVYPISTWKLTDFWQFVSVIFAGGPGIDSDVFLFSSSLAYTSGEWPKSTSSASWLATTV